jgi:hypothetical protein
MLETQHWFGFGVKILTKKNNVSRCRCFEGWLLLDNVLDDRDAVYCRGKR